MPTFHGFLVFLVYYVFIKAAVHVLYAHFGDRAPVLGLLA
jgi:hypothetical protein